MLCKLTDQVNIHFDNREFWQRAEERNATTANIYAKPGLRYAAMEAFVRWKY
jgi:glucosamine-6-phosphate deaminase